MNNDDILKNVEKSNPEMLDEMVDHFGELENLMDTMTNDPYIPESLKEEIRKRQAQS